MPPKYLQQRSPTRLKPCSERTVAVCDNDTHAGCCKVPPCKLCLTLTIYGESPLTGSATEAADGWTGTVGGYSFRSYWERNYEGICEYVVEFNGDEVYRATCEYGASCRNPAGEVEVFVGYPEESAILEWEKYDPRELQLINDPDSGCRTYFCDECRCTCDCLCVIITRPSGTMLYGEICVYGSDPCPNPIWEGSVGIYDLSVELGRDEYGRCILFVTVNGEEQEPVFAPGCDAMTTTVELYDGTIIVLHCKQCGCEQPPDQCCDPRCPPLIALPLEGGGSVEAPGDCENPLPLTLQCDLGGTASDGIATCFNGSGTLTYKTPLSGGVNCWEGVISGTCTDCYGITIPWSVRVTVCCNEGRHQAAMVATGDGIPCPANVVATETYGLSLCDPFMLSGCFFEFAGCWAGCLVDVTLIASPTFRVCYNIYETP